MVQTNRGLLSFVPASLARIFSGLAGQVGVMLSEGALRRSRNISASRQLRIGFIRAEIPRPAFARGSGGQANLGMTAADIQGQTEFFGKSVFSVSSVVGFPFSGSSEARAAICGAGGQTSGQRGRGGKGREPLVHGDGELEHGAAQRGTGDRDAAPARGGENLYR